MASRISRHFPRCKRAASAPCAAKIWTANGNEADVTLIAGIISAWRTRSKLAPKSPAAALPERLASRKRSVTPASASRDNEKVTAPPGRDGENYWRQSGASNVPRLCAKSSGSREERDRRRDEQHRAVASESGATNPQQRHEDRARHRSAHEGRRIQLGAQHLLACVEQNDGKTQDYGARSDCRLKIGETRRAIAERRGETAQQQRSEHCVANIGSVAPRLLSQNGKF